MTTGTFYIMNRVIAQAPSAPHFAKASYHSSSSLSPFHRSAADMDKWPTSQTASHHKEQLGDFNDAVVQSNKVGNKVKKVIHACLSVGGKSPQRSSNC